MPASAATLHRNTFRKQERLTARKIFEQMVSEGKSASDTGFRLVWLKTELPAPVPVQIAFSIPKRIFKNAVDRNRIRRLMRESYRKNKSSLIAFLSERNSQCAVLLVYTGKTIPSYIITEEKIKILLQRLAEDFQKYFK
jgi:ribonuclease P protein component